ncbi:MAG: hypothetical protein V4727_08420 [Verrucomicrobiota bacterium]
MNDMKFNRILSLPLGLCFALCVNFSYAQTVDVSAPGEPAGSNDVNLGLVVPPAGGTFYNNAQVTADPATVTVANSFAPFGSKPDNEKRGEDGSVAYRDRNGVIIWIDNQNRAVTLPNSSKAKTLYVSNSECVVWQNRYDATYNTLDSSSQVVIHRRNLVGQVVSTAVPPIAGTLYETAPVTRSPLGYTLVASKPLEDQPINQHITLYRLTFDGQIQTLNNSYINDVDAVSGELLDNLAYSVVVASSSDGSMVIRDGDYNYIWITWEPGQETWAYMDLDVFTPIYVTNNRLLAYDGTEIYDITKTGDDIVYPAAPYVVPAGYDIIPFDAYTEANTQVILYAMNGLDLQMFTIDGGIAFVGGPLTLPAAINTNLPRVRNLSDGSLLANSEGSQTVLWITATVDFITGAINGLDSVTQIPLSNQGAPMYVSNDEVVVWMNARAPLGSSGDVAPALITHFENSGGPLVSTDLTPPIIGGHVALPPIYTPDPKSQGWFITTFQRISDFSTDVRTYRLQTLEATDSDGDGLFDWQEEALSTDLYNADTDGDEIPDGLEVFPFYLINGSFTYEQAKTDALNRGGTLAVLETDTIRVGTERSIGSLSTGNSYWIGGQSVLAPIPGFPNNREYQWIYPGLIAGVPPTVIVSPPWATGFPTTTGGANSIAINSDYEWTIKPATTLYNYMLLFHGSNPRKPDTDLDGINDDDEYYNGNDPTVPDRFSGVPDLPPPGGPVPFNTAAIATSYYGLVYDPEQGHIASMLMKVSTTGSFTYGYKGLISSITASGRGSFTINGTHSGVGPTGLSDIISVDMQYVQQAGAWVILGVMERASGELIGFELRRQKYSKASPYPTPTLLTMALPLADSVLSEPRGDGAVTGKIDKAGVTSLAIYMPNKERATFKGPILDADLLAINVTSKSLASATLIGPANMASARPSLHYDGRLRFFAQASTAGGQFVNGIDQQRLVNGSRYAPPSKGFFPISGITAITYNTRYNLVGGDFGGITKIGTWDLSNKITIPASPTDSAKVSFTPKSGLLTFGYTLTDADKNMFAAKADGFAVTLQRSKQIRGYYTSAFSTGQLTVSKNDGTVPPITSISPVNKSVPVGSTVYYVNVSTPGDWEVLVPAGPVIISEVTTIDPDTGEATVEEVETPWVTAEIVSGGAGLVGNGNGVVKVTVQENTTGLWFYSTLEIAGIRHKITQDYIERR